MDNNQDTNTQTPPAAIPPSSAGPNADELKVQLEESRKQREGLLRDLQAERTKRQELEAAHSSSAPSAVTPDVNDELGKVLKPYIDPLKKETEDLRSQYHQEKALNYLASKTGKSPDAIMADTQLQEKLIATARKWNLVGNAHEVSQRAYELMELEGLKAKEEERVRASNTGSVASIPSGMPPAPVTQSREYSADDFNRMPVQEFDRLSASGSFRKVDGKFQYVPR